MTNGLRRLGWLGVLVIVVLTCAGLAVVWGVGWSRARYPAAAEHAPAMPDRFYAPSGRLGSLGPASGPLAAIFYTDRQYWWNGGEEDALMGVSATTGRYGFMDLPGPQPSVAGPVLAPDGRHLAYWTGYETSMDKTPAGVTSHGMPTGYAVTGTGYVVTGYAVLDTVTGKVQRFPYLKPNDMPGDFYWVDQATLVLDTRWAKDNVGRLQIIRFPAGQPERLDAHGDLSGAAGHGWMYSSGVTAGIRAGLWNVATGERWTLPKWAGPDPNKLPNRGVYWVQVSPGGKLAADGNGKTMRVVTRAGQVKARTDHSGLPLYWLDDQRLLALAVKPGAKDATKSRLVGAIWDFGTDHWTNLGRYFVPSLTVWPYGPTQNVAYALFANPRVPAVKPPDPLGGKTLVAWSGGVAGAGVVALAIWWLTLRAIAARRRPAANDSAGPDPDPGGAGHEERPQ